VSVLTTRGPIFYSPGDETAFFTWLKRIRAVQRVSGRGRDVEVHLMPGKVSADDLREIRAVFHRYGLDTSEIEAMARG